MNYLYFCILIVESTQELGLIAGTLKAVDRISFADTWVAATAIFYDAVLVHKDPEFEQLKDCFLTHIKIQCNVIKITITEKSAGAFYV
ncbi:MAG: type II toxin-antitoxin system VapC family toxin [Desulfobacteraceae bacterium]|nr:type II toxin-antitoxin system VapC family toxin [Desulfobacteraceae bacterium]